MASPSRITATSSLLIGQWRDARKLKALVDTFSAVVREQIEAPLAEVMSQRRIETARGHWLDVIGKVLGLDRPAVDHAGVRFGFDQAGDGFDRAPFSGDSEHAGKAPLGDAAWRRILRARSISVDSDGTLPTFERGVQALDPSASVFTMAPMSVVVVTASAWLCRLADALGAVPRTAGVRVQYVEPGTFGFDAAGVGFDLAPFGAHAVVAVPANSLIWRGQAIKWRGGFLAWR